MTYKDRIVYSELASFGEIVDAICEGVRTNEFHVVFASAKSHDKYYEPDNIVIGETPDYLVKIGLHHMLSVDISEIIRIAALNIEPGCDKRISEETGNHIKKLPLVIENSFAVLKNKDNNQLIFLYADKNDNDENGKPVLRMAVVQPKGYYSSVLRPGESVNILSYFLSDDDRAREIFAAIDDSNAIDDNKYSIMFFDRKRYDDIISACDLLSEKPGYYQWIKNAFWFLKDSFSVVLLRESYDVSENLKIKRKRDVQRFAVLAENELKDFLSGNHMADFYFGPVVIAKNILSDRNASIGEVLAAVNVMIDTVLMVKDNIYNNAGNWRENDAWMADVVLAVHDIASYNIESRPKFSLECEIRDFKNELYVALVDLKKKMTECENLSSVYYIGDKMIEFLRGSIPNLGLHSDMCTAFDDILRDMFMELVQTVYDWERDKEEELGVN